MCIRDRGGTAIFTKAARVTCRTRGNWTGRAAPRVCSNRAARVQQPRRACVTWAPRMWNMDMDAAHV
eukprot:866488-Prymnesium_polylepis.1